MTVHKLAAEAKSGQEIFDAMSAAEDAWKFPSHPPVEYEESDVWFDIRNPHGKQGVFGAFRELIDNIRHGLGATGQDREETKESLDRSLQSARRLGLDANVRVEITYDTETKKGQILVEHPVIPNISPQIFDLDTAKQARVLDPRNRSLGGIARIEKGFYHEAMEIGKITHSPVQTEDVQKGITKVRRVWIDFEQK